MIFINFGTYEKKKIIIMDFIRYLHNISIVCCFELTYDYFRYSWFIKIKISNLKIF